jgi:hypothetical protein
VKPDQRYSFVVIDMLIDFFEGTAFLARQRSNLVARINELGSVLRSEYHQVIWGMAGTECTRDATPVGAPRRSSSSSGMRAISVPLQKTCQAPSVYFFKCRVAVSVRFG